jgi:hypothetical protein
MTSRATKLSAKARSMITRVWPWPVGMGVSMKRRLLRNQFVRRSKSRMGGFAKPITNWTFGE